LGSTTVYCFGPGTAGIRLHGAFGTQVSGKTILMPPLRLRAVFQHNNKGRLSSSRPFLSPQRWCTHKQIAAPLCKKRLQVFLLCARNFRRVDWNNTVLGIYSVAVWSSNKIP
jgi:hypothetical protein